MTVPAKAIGGRLVLSPPGSLGAGGTADEFERTVQEVFKTGYLHLIADLRGVSSMDSAGIRALVRGLTTAHRLGGSFTLVGPNAQVSALLQAAHLDSVFPTFDTLAPAVARRWPWRAVLSVTEVALFFAALVLTGVWMPLVGTPGQPVPSDGAQAFAAWLARFQPFVELLKLVVAAHIGFVVTAVHRRYRTGEPQSHSLDAAQVLLCVAGALMMVIIGDNTARAFGIAGAAAIIRFRTPVEDPKDITILFLLMGLGMSCGIGAFAVAGLGALFLCGLLAALARVDVRGQRMMMVEIEANGREFPSLHVQAVFARNRVAFEPREVSQAKDVVIRYHTSLNANQSLEELSAELMGAGTRGVKSVSWELPRKNE